MHNKELNNCRVCGLYLEEPPWGDDGKTPNYEICPCCGVEFGYEDSSAKGIASFRSNWINGGMKWFDEKAKPDQWSWENQKAVIPQEFA